MRGSVSAVALFVLAVNVLTLDSCGGEKRAEPASESKVKEIVEAARTASEAITHAATRAQLPDGFPADVPLYTGAKFIGQVAQPGGIIMVKLSSSDPVTTIAAFYGDALSESGWTERPGMDNPAGGKILTFEKNDMALTVQLTEMPDKTKISLNVATNK